MLVRPGFEPATPRSADRRLSHGANLAAVSQEGTNHNSLSRSYLVEGWQAAVDEQGKITAKTPGNNPGAELPLKDLLEQEIEKHVSKI